MLVIKCIGLADFQNSKAVPEVLHIGLGVEPTEKLEKKNNMWFFSGYTWYEFHKKTFAIYISHN